MQTECSIDKVVTMTRTTTIPSTDHHVVVDDSTPCDRFMTSFALPQHHLHLNQVSWSYEDVVWTQK